MSALALTALILSLHVAITDLYARRVSNVALALALTAGLCWILTSQADHSLPLAVVGLGVGLLTLLPFRLIRWMGAGDVKFFSTLGFLLGWKALVSIWVVASIIAGIHAALVISVMALQRRGHGRPPRCFRALNLYLRRSVVWQRMREARQGRHGIPYAAYLSIGTGSLLLQNGGSSHV